MIDVWVGNEPNPDDRLKLRVSDHDRARIDLLPHGLGPERVQITDLLTGKQYTLRRANCGLGCCCALAVSGEEK